MFSEEMKRFDADMNSKEELVAKFGEICDRLSKEMQGSGASEFELMAKAANELGYQITAEEMERNTVEKETVDPEELASAVGGIDWPQKSGGEDEKGHDAWCLTLWHCNVITLHTEHETNRRVSCWSDHQCVINYYSGCYNDWKVDEKPLPDK
mgnify:FL=1